ncbi:SocA family protein [Stenotrophomonas sp. CW117]|uniref:Panacea domain-containing protein n=1 Tax=Stenotrophomonas TaxID=40323 RepID=UPI00177D70F9|nr:Panacea domain-containing protein [Stenotrophomonas sp. CW117]QOF99777.1 SocA family protein [Stenotrophomonas sp. CW117]
MAYNERKTAQIAARLIGLSGASMNIVKLMKLLYLVDREALRRGHRPLTGDRMVSMPRGPVLSATYEVTNGMSTLAGGWSDWMTDRSNHKIALRGDCPARDDLDELSDNDLAVVDGVWEKFGPMGQWDLVEFTHQNCKEWVDPRGSSLPISYQDVLRAQGFSEGDAARVAAEIDHENELDRLFAGA